MLRSLRSIFSLRRLPFVLALLTLVAAVGVWQYWPSDSSRRVTPSQALADFQRLIRRNPDRGTPVAGLPAPGVYRYSISGAERLSSVLSAEHRYGGIATISVTVGACGIEERWRVLRERWTAARLCLDGRQRRQLVQIREHHEFFGNVQNQFYVCRPPAGQGATRCSSPSGSISYSTRSLGTETVTIGGGRSELADHLVSRATLSGDTNGNGSTEEWRRASDGLLLKKMLAVSASVASVAGEYDESYRMKLLAPRPDR